MPLPLALGLAAMLQGALRWAIGPLITALAALLRSRMGTWIVLAFMYLGVGFATQKFAFGPAFNALENYANVSGGGDFAQTALETMGTLNFDICLTMVMSAIVTKYAVGAARLFFTKM